ncbi:hypothetical protein K9M74_02440 [Candidatus Woesearchaeota archaeon]|nr:hypothetical protein [Candidatus Woesearchaeota archaeon]
MFVRAKKVKEKQYAYLVENDWVKGKVKQKVKNYLGRIIQVPPINELVIVSPIDFSLSKKDCIRQLITAEFLKRGFSLKGNFLINEDIKISLNTGKITADKKNVVLLINERYLYYQLLDNLLDFFAPESEEDTKGEKLATAFSDAGIAIASEHFIALYKKIYLE